MNRRQFPDNRLFLFPQEQPWSHCGDRSDSSNSLQALLLIQSEASRLEYSVNPGESECKMTEPSLDSVVVNKISSQDGSPDTIAKFIMLYYYYTRVIHIFTLKIPSHYAHSKYPMHLGPQVDMSSGYLLSLSAFCQRITGCSTEEKKCNSHSKAACNRLRNFT